MSVHVAIRELAAWGLDESPYRPASLEAVGRAGSLTMHEACVAIPEVLLPLLKEQARREDLMAEMDGLDWSVGVVDLRGLVAFQRRIAFDPEATCAIDVAGDDWTGLMRIAFGAPVPLVYRQRIEDGCAVIETANPNLQWRVDTLALHGGSPFFEVGVYGGRWFLRDGYHRAYALLRAGIDCVPAVVVRARSLAELGPVGPWFFAEETLFDARPPMVTDFLDDALTFHYTRPRLLKTIRIAMEESFRPDDSQHTKGEQR